VNTLDLGDGSARIDCQLDHDFTTTERLGNLRREATLAQARRRRTLNGRADGN
jgi:hypothetical protein